MFVFAFGGFEAWPWILWLDVVVKVDPVFL
jgi:hypothetical protein